MPKASTIINKQVAAVVANGDQSSPCRRRVAADNGDDDDDAGTITKWPQRRRRLSASARCAYQSARERARARVRCARSGFVHAARARQSRTGSAKGLCALSRAAPYAHKDQCYRYMGQNLAPTHTHTHTGAQAHNWIKLNSTWLRLPFHLSHLRGA